MQQWPDKPRTHLGVTPPRPFSPGVRLARCKTTPPVISSHKLRGPQGWWVSEGESRVVLFLKTEVRSPSCRLTRSAPRWVVLRRVEFSEQINVFCIMRNVSVKEEITHIKFFSGFPLHSVCVSHTDTHSCPVTFISLFWIGTFLRKQT